MPANSAATWDLVATDAGRPRTRIVPALQARIAADETWQREVAAAAAARHEEMAASEAFGAGRQAPGHSAHHRPTFGRRVWGATKAVLGTAGIYIGGVVVAALLLGFISGATSRLANPIRIDLVHGPVLLGNLLVLIVLMIRAVNAGRRVRDLFAPPDDWRRAARLMWPWALGGAVLAGLVALLTVLAPKLMEGGPTTVAGLARLEGATWILAVVTATIAAPVVEELVFRGHLQGRLAAAGLGRIATLLVATSLFTAAHVPLPIPGLVIIFGIGWACGYLRERTGSVLPGMMLHAGWNTAIVLIASLAAAQGKV